MRLVKVIPEEHSIASYVYDIRGKLSKAEQERDELQAKVAVLRGALERLTETIDDQIPLGGYCEEIDLNIDVMFEPWASLFEAKERANAALLLTPA